MNLIKFLSDLIARFKKATLTIGLPSSALQTTGVTGTTDDEAYYGGEGWIGAIPNEPET